MMNKGLEVIEARWLFDMPLEGISVLVHPESIVHSMVEYKDGSVMAQLGPSDMRLPIQHALFYPRREESPWPRLDLVRQGSLTFEDLDHEAFPCFDLCMEALKKGGTYPTVLNAANEMAVSAFLQGRISFLHIPAIIEEVMEKHVSKNEMELSEILAADRWARKISQVIIERR
jgi:1-deoxy-D-xylulose-5-phosphate reductoisomerase